MAKKGEISSLFEDGETNYIYHIIVDDKVYVGQSKAQDPGGRLRYRLRGAFANKNFEPADLGEAIRSKGLKETTYRIFRANEGGSIYGIPKNIIDSFKNKFDAIGGRNKDTKTMNDVDVAEILHIYYFTKQKYKLWNRSMGGEYGGFYYKKTKTKALTRNMTPQEARSILDAKTLNVKKIDEYRKNLNTKIFKTDWKSFWNMLDSESKHLFLENSNYNVDLCIQSFEDLVRDVYDILDKKLSDLITSKNSYFINKLEKEIEKLITSWVYCKIDLLYDSGSLSDMLENTKAQANRRLKLISRVKDGLEVDIDAQPLIDYIKESIKNWLIDPNKIVDLYKHLLPPGVKPNKFNVIKALNNTTNRGLLGVNIEKMRASDFSRVKSFSVASIKGYFNIKNSLSNSNLKGQPAYMGDWSIIGGTEISEEIKQNIAYNIFSRIVNKVKTEDFYLKLPTYSFINFPGMSFYETVFSTKWYKGLDRSKNNETLSFKVHEEYRRRKITFPEKSWNDFYRPMISRYTNSRVQWEARSSGSSMLWTYEGLTRPKQDFVKDTRVGYRSFEESYDLDAVEGDVRIWLLQSSEASFKPKEIEIY